MTLGDLYKFAVITDVVGAWNIDRSFDNGALMARPFRARLSTQHSASKYPI